MNLARGLTAGALVIFLFVSALPAQTAQEDAHPAGACSAPYHVSGAGWDLCWQRDDSRAQGLEINAAYFQGQSVAWKMGAPFSMTKYHNTGIGPFKDTLGSPGAGGHPGYGAGALALDSSVCPRFFGASATLLSNNRICVEERAGPEPALMIWAKYNIYNYRFIQGWYFDSRGHVEPMIRMGGNLIDGQSGANGNNHFHHLIWRIDFDIAAAGNDEFQVFSYNTGGGPFGGQRIGNDGCEIDGMGGTATWCTVPTESTFKYIPETAMKFRVKDAGSNNGNNNAKSYEFRVAGGDMAADAFSTMDAMVVQYKGDSAEVGWEVPTNPVEGDKQLYRYLGPPEPVTDPVAWIFLHMYHDTRDEDRCPGSCGISYHEARGHVLPHNMFATNPGEPSYP